MSDREDKPDPDELLKQIQKKEKLEKSGKLKIFFGMVAGVGKTYAMLEEAHRRQKEGLNVVIGTVNTNGRKETEELVKGLNVIPEKWVKYKNSVFEELDIDKILEVHPDIVLIDELAHTNVPGSRHVKRWQDVFEVLDAGIDVYTTLNVQHIESRKEIIESLTDVPIRETVPDIILERATSIELIDLSPDDLLDRLKHGKVYLGDQSAIAAKNFFKEENLTALREIALRLLAEKVDHDLHGLMLGKGWKTRERLLVGISYTPSTESLLREARRLAFELDAYWVAVYVDTGISLDKEEQDRLAKYCNFARDLGAEVITVHDTDIENGISRIARQKDISRIVIGRPSPRSIPFLTPSPSKYINRLAKKNPDVDIVLLRYDPDTVVIKTKIHTVFESDTFASYAIAFGTVMGLTAIGVLLNSFFGYKVVGFIYLIGILFLSQFAGIGPIYLAAALSGFVWVMFFIPPFLSFYLHNPEDIAMFALFFFAAVLLGGMTSRLQKHDRFLALQEEKMGYLREIDLAISQSTTTKSMIKNVSSVLESIFKGGFDILVVGKDKKLNLQSIVADFEDEKEKSAALWTFRNGKPGGWSTDTLPSAKGLYFPIRASGLTLGVLCYFSNRDHVPSLDEKIFLQNVTQQIGLFLQKHKHN